MTRSRIISVVVILVLSGAGLTLLMAARSAGDRPDDPAASRPSGEGRRLVCLGYVDTPDRITSIFPDNFPMQSRVIEVLAREGNQVKKGQPLLRFDTKILDLKVQEAEVAIQAALAEQKKAESMLRAHKPQVDALEKDWRAKEAELLAVQNELKEAERLFELRISVNQLTLDEKKAKVTAAELSLDSAKIKWEALRVEVPNFLVDLAKENVERLRILKSQAEHARDQMACKAPADGRIIRSFVSEGMMFGPHTREPAFWFVKDGPLLVRVEVTQEFARRIAVGQPARIEDEADPEQRWTGKVTRVGDQFLTKRSGGTSAFDLMPVADDRVLECEVAVDATERPMPKFGQKVRVTLD